MLLLEFSMTPLGKGESVGKYVARSLDIVDKSGLPYRLTAMGTILEGEWDECFEVVKRCQRRMRKDCGRISIGIKADWRRGARGRLAGKVASVEKRLRRKLGK
ncbi:MAG: MTH1187 family thiamine-binding protein [Elusimicrobiota bacterium]